MARLFLGTHEEPTRLAALDELSNHCEFVGQRGASRNILIMAIADAYAAFPNETIELLNKIKLLSVVALADELTGCGKNDPAA